MYKRQQIYGAKCFLQTWAIRTWGPGKEAEVVRVNCTLVPTDDDLGFELCGCLLGATRHRHDLGYEVVIVGSVLPTLEEVVATNG